MLKPSQAALPASIDQSKPAAVDSNELRLRALTNRLPARFPDVRSSHLTEAIAAIGPAKMDAAPAPVRTTPKFVVAHFAPNRSAVMDGNKEKISPQAKKHRPESAMNQTG